MKKKNLAEVTALWRRQLLCCQPPVEEGAVGGQHSVGLDMGWYASIQVEAGMF